MATPPKKRVLSGMRSTGKLHLGNYVGALENWVRMQEQYECFFCVADWHALTTDYVDTSRLKENSIDVLLDWLAAGLDPAKSVIFIQSHVPAHAELHLLFSMITPLGWLERVPTYKEQRENIKDKDLGTYGFLGYPVLQSADILIYKADVVPVGEDQVAHVELTREIARRFNGFYGEVFPEPKSLLTPAPKLPGTDGRKMSKSYGNTILLTDSEPVLRQKLKTMVTDPARVRRSDPGNPDVCPVGDRGSSEGQHLHESGTGAPDVDLSVPAAKLSARRHLVGAHHRRTGGDAGRGAARGAESRPRCVAVGSPNRHASESRVAVGAAPGRRTVHGFRRAGRTAHRGRPLRGHFLFGGAAYPRAWNPHGVRRAAPRRVTASPGGRGASGVLGIGAGAGCDHHDCRRTQ